MAAPFNPLPTPPVHERPPLQLFGWGENSDGQLAMGAIPGGFEKPRRNIWIEEKMEEDAFGPDGAGLETVAAGGMHTLFIDESGTVWSCGVNDEGCLGRVTVNVPDPDAPGNTLDPDTLSSTPYPIQALLDENFRAVRIAAGDNVSAAISSDGELRVWGSFRDRNGRLGFSKGSSQQFVPVSIFKFRAATTEKCVSVVAGNNHLLILTTHGNVFGLGVGEEGQLGRKIIERRKINGTVPERVVIGKKSRKVVAVGAGGWTSFAVDEDGDVWGWGMNTMGQTGTGVRKLHIDDESPAPKKVVGLSKQELGGKTIVEIVGGEHHTLFLTSDGKIYACGRSTSGQLGLPADHAAFKDREYPDFIPEPVLIPFEDPNDPVVRIAVGMHNNLAVTASGVMFTWGQQTVGVLGTGEDEDVLTPTVIVRRSGQWAAVVPSCGGQHSLALLRRR